MELKQFKFLKFFLSSKFLHYIIVTAIMYILKQLLHLYLPHVQFSSIQFNLFCVHHIQKGVYDPQDTEHVNSVTPSVYIIICTEQTMK
jgi:hypothetical protein